MDENRGAKTTDSMSGYFVCIGFVILAMLFLMLRSDPNLPTVQSVHFDVEEIAPGAWRQAMQDPPMINIGTLNQRCSDCHALFSNDRADDRDLTQHTHIQLKHGNNDNCLNCHAKDDREKLALRNGGLVGFNQVAQMCAQCHGPIYNDWERGTHGKTIGYWDSTLSESIKLSCTQCHGSEVKVLPGGKLDPATYPNSGIGRINPDGTEGSCNACHTRHDFSVAQARHPDTCGKCHLGPDHPQKEIYEESKHGILFFSKQDEMNLDNEKWIAGEDYWAAPTCATCHMSQTKTQDVTHDVGMRISWNNRPAVSIRPEVSDAKMGLPGKDVPWQVRRENMQDVCMSCHQTQWVDNFYIQYDALVELYNTKFAIPGKELYELSAPLKSPVPFANKIDFTWFEIWHHEGRRARHGASMMAPDYTHWHGTYEIARNFYSEYIPELRELIENGLHSDDLEKVEAARVLDAKLEEVLNSDNHKWFLGKMDDEESAARKKAAEEFKARYKD